MLMNNSIHKLIQGTAMGNKMAPAYYVNLFMGKLEEQFYFQITGRTEATPLSW
jgi:hypothetical protein